MNEIDKIYTAYPFYGVPRMTDELHTKGYTCNHKRIARLMQVMGIAAIVPGPHTSKPHPEHVKYPYLLRDRIIKRPNEVWCADITYIPMLGGFLYLVAIMDWYSRYVLSWALSNMLDPRFCLDALEEAFRIAMPVIFNTDQGPQFTCDDWIERLKKVGILVSMDGRGRALDNVFIERLWRTVKYEDIYVRDYLDGKALHNGLDAYFRYYNTERRHASLGRLTPLAVYSR
jgi:putative transposase